MIDALRELLVVGSQELVILGAVFLRVAAVMALLPGFGERVVPMRVRLALAVAFTVVVTPMLGAAEDARAAQGGYLLFFTEPVAGLALGALFRLLVAMLQVAGSMAAQATSLGQVFTGGAVPEPMPAFGNLMVAGGLALAMAAGLHTKAAVAIGQSYAVLPMGVFAAADDLASVGLAAVSRMFGLAFSLAAPFVLASVLYNVALGAINRAMPQLMVAFIGVPAITLGSLILMTLGLPAILIVWLGYLDAGFQPFSGVVP